MKWNITKFQQFNVSGGFTTEIIIQTQTLLPDRRPSVRYTFVHLVHCIIPDLRFAYLWVKMSSHMTNSPLYKFNDKHEEFIFS